jgi:hypothetical protein
MAPIESADDAAPRCGEVEFFGVKLKVQNPRLAVLLNGGVTDEVQVVVGRARDALSADDAQEAFVTDRVLHADGSSTPRLDETEDV